MISSGDDHSLRVLHVLARNQRRGAENAAMHLAAALGEHNVTNVLVALDAGPPGQEQEGVTVLSEGRGGRLRRVPALRRAIRRIRPDVVLCHGGDAALAAAIADVRGRAPLVWHRILELPETFDRSVFRRCIWRVLASRVTAAVAISPHLVEETRGLGVRGPVWYLPNHRPWSLFGVTDPHVPRSALRMTCSAPPDAPIVGWVGHFVRQKRPDRFVEVAAHCRTHAAMFVMAGDGPLHRATYETAQREGIGDRIVFLGHRDDIPSVLAGMDLIVITSETESMTGVAIEAQMSGVPVVCVDLDGLDEIVVTGITGVIVEDDDPRSLSLAVDTILGDRETLASMSRAAREHSREFATETQVNRYVELLDGLARRPRNVRAN